MKTLYTASATATSGREGRIVADDPKLDLPLSVPQGLGGTGGEGTNPEQMFAGGYAACFSSALAHIARVQKVDLGDYDMTARVAIGKADGGAFGLAVELIGRLPSLERSKAEALMQDAHAVCPYSNATRGQRRGHTHGRRLIDSTLQ